MTTKNIDIDLNSRSPKQVSVALWESFALAVKCTANGKVVKHVLNDGKKDLTDWATIDGYNFYAFPPTRAYGDLKLDVLVGGQKVTTITVLRREESSSSANYFYTLTGTFDDGEEFSFRVGSDPKYAND